MKKGWEIKKLEAVCEIEYGTRVVRKKDGGTIYPVYGGGGATFFMDIPNREDCLVVARFAMSEQCTRFVKGEFFLNDSGLSVKPKNTNEINQEFLNWQFLHLNDLIYSLARGAAQKNLNVPVFRKIDINYPKSLPEQKRIVSILDKTFAEIAQAKANAEQNLKNAKELFESYLQGVFENDNWEEKKLDEVCEITSKLIDPKKQEYQNLLHVGAGNIVSQKGTLIDLKTAKEENLISGKFLFDEKMVLYSKIRPYLMKIVKCDFKGLCSADIYPLASFKDIITQEFLFHLLSSNHFTEYAIEGSQRAGMPKVNRKHLFDYSFYCPSIKKQNQIVEKLDKLSVETKNLESVYQQKLEDLEDLKKSVLQKAFNGEL
ncbi:MAG: restriction endonuclease subunit S [Bacteroidetes bacterium]|nr:MAG: restriction endonuclease subunit S [Bacteroidota bacterium]